LRRSGTALGLDGFALRRLARCALASVRVVTAAVLDCGARARLTEAVLLCSGRNDLIRDVV
jgi:hypothetical protein